MSGHGSPGRHLSSLGPGEPGVTGPGAAGFRERFASPGPQEAVWAKRSLPASSSLWPDLCVARPDPKDLLPGRASASRP